MDIKSTKTSISILYNSAGTEIFEVVLLRAVLNLEPDERRELNTFIYFVFLFSSVTQTRCTMETFRKVLEEGHCFSLAK